MVGTKGVRLEPLSDPSSTTNRGARVEVMSLRAGGAAGTAVSRPARLTSLNPKAAVQRYMQDHKVTELLHNVTGDVILAKPANPARFIVDWMSALLGPDEAESVAEASRGCFLRVHVECGLQGKIVRQHFSRRAPQKGFQPGAMREWRREASGVLATVVDSVLGDDIAEGGGREPWKPLDDAMRALADRVREVEEELRLARAELEKSREVAVELRAQLAEAEADLKGGGHEEHASGVAAKASWECSDELRARLRKVFDKVFTKMDLNNDGTVDAEEMSKTSVLLNELHVEFGLRAEVQFTDSMTFAQFETRLVRELELTRKEQALGGGPVARAVAERLPGGSPEKPLQHLVEMSGEELRHFCRTSVAAGVEQCLRLQQETIRQLRQQTGGGGDSGAGEQGNAKFAQGGAVLGQARFGELKEFTSGLLGKLGLPDPRLFEANP
ncbi:hypothetical protein T484DRAFT_1809523 [Baffinella frigidus]|nr:hypothetical protein T484DRAFT_1809523 [Cryptophyta sp. CCMP2293]